MWRSCVPPADRFHRVQVPGVRQVGCPGVHHLGPDGLYGDSIEDQLDLDGHRRCRSLRTGTGFRPLPRTAPGWHQLPRRNSANPRSAASCSMSTRSWTRCWWRGHPMVRQLRPRQVRLEVQSARPARSNRWGPPRRRRLLVRPVLVNPSLPSARLRPAAAAAARRSRGPRRSCQLPRALPARRARPVPRDQWVRQDHSSPARPCGPWAPASPFGPLAPMVMSMRSK